MLARAKLTALRCALESSQAEKLGAIPPPEQFIKLSGQAADGGGVIRWRGRLRGGVERALQGSWVRCNFKASFVSTVLAAGGAFQPTTKAPFVGVDLGAAVGRGVLCSHGGVYAAAACSASRRTVAAGRIVRSTMCCTL